MDANNFVVNRIKTSDGMGVELFSCIDFVLLLNSLITYLKYILWFTVVIISAEYIKDDIWLYLFNTKSYVMRPIIKKMLFDSSFNFAGTLWHFSMANFKQIP